MTVGGHVVIVTFVGSKVSNILCWGQTRTVDWSDQDCRLVRPALYHLLPQENPYNVCRMPYLLYLIDKNMDFSAAML